MTSSLRSRLWWSYVLVTAAALLAVAVILFVYIVRNPSTYRQASARLTVVATLLRKSQGEWGTTSADAIQKRIERLDKTYNTRIILYDANRQVVADSQSGQQSLFKMPSLPRLRSFSFMRDQEGIPWLYAIQRMNNGQWLLVAVPRPAVPLLSILTDELMVPILLAGIVALFISLLVAYWLARWVGNPLQEIVIASRKMPSAEVKPIGLRGPHEVQELSRAFTVMNQRVQATQQSQRKFVANVSHELKTPLTAVQGFAQAILDGTANTPEAQRQAVQVIYDEAERMHRMVLDLLDLARLDAGTLELQLTPVDISALLNNIAEKFTPQARAANVSIQIESTDLPAITGDGDRLGQVFTNLVDNALKFTPAGGNIRLKATTTANSVQIEVADSGSGIPAEAIAHIFDRFYQADPSRSGGTKHGAGLGLAIAKEIMAAHGGKIDVRSLPGTGSVFTVTIPMSTPKANKIVLKR